MPIKDIIIAISIPCLWGFGFVIAKPGMEQLPPLLINGLRWWLAGLILVWWFPVPRNLFKEILILSFVACTLQYGLTFSGLNLVEASSAIIIVQFEVPFGVLAAFLILKEKPPLKNLLGLLIAGAGLFILTGAPNLEGQSLGITLLLSGAAVWALGQIIAKSITGKINGIALTAWVGIMSGPQLVLASALIDGNTINYITSANSIAWLIVIYQATLMTALGYSLWYFLLSKYPVNKVMPIHLLLPFTGVLAAVFLLGERPDIKVYFGGIIIIIGVAIILYSKSENRV